MPEARFDQFSFSQGEVDPRIQSRPDWEGYYKSAKFIRNAQVIPQGGVQRRWGTKYVATCQIANPAQPFTTELCTLLYDADIIYLLVWEPNNLNIFLEDILIATVPNTGYLAEDIVNLRFAQVEDRLIIANVNFQPKQLVRSANSPINITGFGGNTLTIATPIPVGVVYPVVFASGTLPTTSPQIFAGRTYFIVATTPTTVQIYSDPDDAANGTNAYTITSAGAGSTVVIQNTWALSNITFINVPTYDFSSGYSAITFTPNADTGNVTITLSAPLANLTSIFVGGLFTGNGGIVRITSVADTSHFSGYTVSSFNSTDPIQGTLAYLGEPAWSNLRGWPRLVSFFQNRLVFAGSISLPNGVWLSVVNAVYDFDDSEALDDNAISWYPANGSINLIVAITSARSLMVHTNNGTLSTPLLNENPLTPTNFVLTEQNKFSVQPIQPIFIDNQVIFVDTASNVINLIWEITQSAFITNNISVMSSYLINAPVDMTAFYEPKATDGFYGMFVNGDGTLAVYQTLHEQNIGAWSLMNTVTNIPIDQISNFQTVQSNYIHIFSSYNRCWFIVQRFLPAAQTPVTITGFNSGANTLFAMNHGLTIGASNQVSFTSSGIFPISNPQINGIQFWWARGIDANNFAVYTSVADATADTNRVTISSAGINTQVINYILAPQLFIEELTFSVLTDVASVQAMPSPSMTVSNLTYLNGTVVNVKGDGYVLANATVFNGGINTGYLGTNYEVGQNYVTKLTPLPVALPGVFGTLYKPKHIRCLYIRYYQSIGVTLQGFNIPVINMQDQTLDTVPQPQDGVYPLTPMEGWTNFDVDSPADINIIQDNPLPMTILGLSYVLEV